MKKRILVLLCISFISASTFAGGWVQKKGNGYYKLSEWWVVFNQHYTDAGRIDPNVTMGLFNTNLYVEHGLNDHFTGLLNIPLFSRNYMNNLVSSNTGNILAQGEGINSIGDAEIGLKYGISRNKTPVSLSLVLGLPFGIVSGGAMENLQTGDGEFNQMLKADISKGFSLRKTQHYVNVYVGYNNRSKGFSDEIKYGIEYGLSKNRVYGNIQLFGVESMRNSTLKDQLTSTSVFANNSSYTSSSIELGYYISNRFGVSAGIANAFKGEIIAAAPSYNIGIFIDTNK